MPQLIDCYFLVENRSPKTVNDFLDRFIPKNMETTNEYIVPHYSENPDFVFDNAASLLDYLHIHQYVTHSIYWKNQNANESIQFGMVFHTNDRKMIVGVSIVGDAPTNNQVLTDYNLIRDFLNSKISCITVEEPAPSNSEEFIDFAKTRFQPG